MNECRGVVRRVAMAVAVLAMVASAEEEEAATPGRITYGLKHSHKIIHVPKVINEKRVVSVPKVVRQYKFVKTPKYVRENKLVSVTKKVLVPKIVSVPKLVPVVVDAAADAHRYAPRSHVPHPFHLHAPPPHHRRHHHSFGIPVFHAPLVWIPAWSR